VCCSVLLCVAVCCSVLQCVAVCCSVLQCAAMMQCAAVSPRQSFGSLFNKSLRHDSHAQHYYEILLALQLAAVRYSVLRRDAVCCSVLQRVAVCFRVSSTELGESFNKGSLCDNMLH